KSRVYVLSGGERQRLSAALAFINRPEAVFLDELTTGLDTAARREVWGKLKEFKSAGTTVFLTTHYMEEAESLCDRVCIIKKGKKVIEGTVEEVIGRSPHDNLEEAYLWYMGEGDAQ
ncbi:MAG: ABC transporter ATP-binding protein, partial [Bacillota bacterium]|nr:ABC transporter ATP-binding protein [Bacillota bacterium]